MAERSLPRILLVDDDPDIARLVQHILSSHGFGPAIQVTTGREALAALNGVDIVLLDQQLPQRPRRREPENESHPCSYSFCGRRFRAN